MNLLFDIYGPLKVNDNAGEHKGFYYGGDKNKREVFQILSETEETDFSIYDWDGDGTKRKYIMKVYYKEL